MVTLLSATPSAYWAFRKAALLPFVLDLRNGLEFVIAMAI
jgi:hypothetical protein